MSRYFYQLRCVACQKITPEEKSITNCCFCGESLDVEINFQDLKNKVSKNFNKTKTINGLKYTDFYPLKTKNPISFGEGGTPLIHLKKISEKLKLPNLFVKNEGQNPTGVFKDRGSLVELTKALELKAKAIVCASTGNMAASVSAYSAVAGLPCYVLIPEGTPMGKLAQALAYGARILAIRGTYGDCCRLAEQMAIKNKFYLAGDYAFRAEGQKSLAYEVVEQLGWQAPDIVIVPVGCGTNLAAIWKGFKEFYQLGFIKHLPKLVAVQPNTCSTICAAFNQKLSKAPIITNPLTVCSAVGIGTPLDDRKALKALQESQGKAVTVADTEVVAAAKNLGALEAIFTEPSGALPLAALAELKKSKFIKSSDTIVLVATGNGLKDPKNALAAHPMPPAVEPLDSEIDRFLKYKLYTLRSSGYIEKEKILFTKSPSESELAKAIKKEFNADLKTTHLKEILGVIKTFLKKGKKIDKADLQHLVEDALTDLTYQSRVLVVEDYELSVSRQHAPKAKVLVCFQGKKLKAEAQGVGPVDAVIAAVRLAIRESNPLEFKLTDYNVRIDERGTDATTKVTMKLRDAANNAVFATATSPDIIAASIAAFEKGFNILWWKQSKI